MAVTNASALVLGEVRARFLSEAAPAVEQLLAVTELPGFGEPGFDHLRDRVHRAALKVAEADATPFSNGLRGC
ncbi:hypothetical protein [Longimicrobium terrae]|uniref:Uncharacterized protein n=1 Tax=Longimicrobium terrae TaxID=1639882 RepID=A0A841GQ98_9BACT|nr:hypothetical protein [Longimicrobium terrae]MBB4634805.1 hypothetical protein [Longimicrobium terrae]MBB6069200.1 hypothetical protein [Longimicrobium terrae]